MPTTISVLFVASLVPSTTAAKLAAQPEHAKQRKYLAPMAVRPLWFGPPAGGRRSEYESKIVFQSADGTMAGTLDDTSEDNERGFGVVKAEWTANSRYLYLVSGSSGGHQAWHAPTQFLSPG